MIKAEDKQDTQPYWTFHDTLADAILLKGKRTAIFTLLQHQTLDQLHSNMGIENTCLLTCKSIYWITINDDI